MTRLPLAYDGSVAALSAIETADESEHPRRVLAGLRGRGAVASAVVGSVARCS